VAVAAMPGAFGALAYHRGGVLQGELWRLLTGHLVHASPSHLLWDLLPLLCLGFLFERCLARSLWGTLGISAVVVGGGLLLLSPALAVYSGLSGVLNGLWVAGALTAAARERASGDPRLALLYELCVLADLAKVAAEAATGAPLLTDPVALGGTPIPLAHALGALGGFLSWRLRRTIGGTRSSYRLGGHPPCPTGPVRCSP
jgi:rhomboid family GlyGly-CTERM serine protease